MNPRILELAKQVGLADDDGGFYELFYRELEAFYQLAHQDGQRSMRERAEHEVAEFDACDPKYICEAIRNLEITNE